MRRLLILLLLSSPLGAQTWFTVVPASQQSLSTTVTLPVGATYRIGNPLTNQWTAPIVVTALTAKVIDYADGKAGHPPDPAPGVPKEFDVLETSAVQTVTVNTTAVTVPALPAVQPLTLQITCTGKILVPPGTFPSSINLSSVICTAVPVVTP